MHHTRRSLAYVMLIIAVVVMPTVLALGSDQLSIAHVMSSLGGEPRVGAPLLLRSVIAFRLAAGIVMPVLGPEACEAARRRCANEFGGFGATLDYGSRAPEGQRFGGSQRAPVATLRPMSRR